MTLFLHACIFLLATAASSAWAQSNSTNGTEAYFVQLADCLQSAGLTSLAAVASVLTMSSACPAVAALPNGTAWTIFAPTNQALGTIPDSISSNNDTLAKVLCYHIVSGNFTSPSNASLLDSANYPNVTIGRTLLNDNSSVHLEGNKSQVLVWTKQDEDIMFLNQAMNITVTGNSTQCDNAIITTIDGVLTPPVSLSDNLLGQTSLSQNLSSLAGFLNSTTTTIANGTNITIVEALSFDTVYGYTLFAPNDAALRAVGSSLTTLASNMTALSILLGNHIINGTTVYSTSLTSDAKYTSASGQPLSFNTNSSGTFVHSGGDTSAKIVMADVLLDNGVLHVIEGVLVNAESDSAAAISAYEAATSSAGAAASTTETGPVGASPTTTEGAGNGGGGNGAPGLFDLMAQNRVVVGSAIVGVVGWGLIGVFAV